MKKYKIKIQRDFEAEIDAVDITEAAHVAKRILAGFPPGTAKILYIVQEGVEAVPVQPDSTPTPPRPFGRPRGGGSPGTPVVRRDILVDAIAKVA